MIYDFFEFVWTSVGLGESCIATFLAEALSSGNNALVHTIVLNF